MRKIFRFVAPKTSPKTSTLAPYNGQIYPRIVFTRVVFPAPFAPRIKTLSPLFTCQDISDKISFPSIQTVSKYPFHIFVGATKAATAAGLPVGKLADEEHVVKTVKKQKWFQ